MTARTILLTATALSSLPTAAWAQNAEARTQKVLMWAVQELARIEGMAGTCPERGAMQRQLGQVRAQLNGLLRRQPTPAAEAPGPDVAGPSAPTIQPMDPGAFDQLLASVNAQVMIKGKLAVISQAAFTNYFSCRQVFSLLNTIPVSGDRLRALKLVNIRIIDRQNAPVIYEAFPFHRDKEKAAKILLRGR